MEEEKWRWRRYGGEMEEENRMMKERWRRNGGEMEDKWRINGG